MELTISHLRAARALANGASISDVARKVNVARGTIYGYQKLPEFQSAVQVFKEEQIEQAVSNEADVTQSRDDELALRQYIRPLAEETCGLVLDLVRHFREQGVENISPSRIQGLMNSAVEAIECLRKGNDRISGLEVLLDELSKTQEVHAAKVVPLTVCHSTATDEGAS